MNPDFSRRKPTESNLARTPRKVCVKLASISSIAFICSAVKLRGFEHIRIAFLGNKTLKILVSIK